jgi:hypothetical protein
MNYLDCTSNDRPTPAVEICYDCGAGICLDHAVTRDHYLKRILTFAHQTICAGNPERSSPATGTSSSHPSTAASWSTIDPTGEEGFVPTRFAES